jgi:hypothetical protein
MLRDGAIPFNVDVRHFSAAGRSLAVSRYGERGNSDILESEPLPLLLRFGG